MWKHPTILGLGACHLYSASRGRSALHQPPISLPLPLLLEGPEEGLLMGCSSRFSWALSFHGNSLRCWLAEWFWFWLQLCIGPGGWEWHTAHNSSSVIDLNSQFSK